MKMKSLQIKETITDKSDILLAYYRDVNKYNNLNNDEIVKQIQEGKEGAVDLLIKANLKFVISVARQYYITGVTIEDLINEGNIGLIKSAQKFDPSCGVKFISYAVFEIRAHILSYIKDNSRVVRIPQNKQVTMYVLKKQLEKLQQELGTELTYAEALSLLDAEPISLELAFATRVNNGVSIDKPSNETNKPISESDLFNDTSFRQDINHDNKEFFNILKYAMNQLDEYEYELISSYWGLGDRDTENIVQLGKLCGISTWFVQKKLENIMDKLKEFIYKKYPDFAVNEFGFKIPKIVTRIIDNPIEFKGRYVDKSNLSIICLTDNEEFKTIAEVSKSINLKPNTFSDSFYLNRPIKGKEYRYLLREITY